MSPNRTEDSVNQMKQFCRLFSPFTTSVDRQMLWEYLGTRLQETRADLIPVVIGPCETNAATGPAKLIGGSASLWMGVGAPVAWL